MTAVINHKKQLFTFGKKSYNRLGHVKDEIEKVLDNVDQVTMGYRHGFAWNSEGK